MLAVLTWGAAACGVAPDPLVQAADDGSSATASAALVLRETARGRSTPAAARATVQDAATQVAGALGDASVTHRGSPLVGRQDRLLELLTAAAANLVRAEAAIDGSRLRAVSADLEDDAARLSRLATSARP